MNTLSDPPVIAPVSSLYASTDYPDMVRVKKISVYLARNNKLFAQIVPVDKAEKDLKILPITNFCRQTNYHRRVREGEGFYLTWHRNIFAEVIPIKSEI